MKKLLFITCLLFSTPVYAEDFITTLGAECFRILHNLSEYNYPTNSRVETERNKQFGYLEKCLFLYKDNGGNLQELNKKYQKASFISKHSLLFCMEKNPEDEKKCFTMFDSVFKDVILGRECEYFTDNNAFYINDLLTYCKKE